MVIYFERTNERTFLVLCTLFLPQSLSNNSSKHSPKAMVFLTLSAEQSRKYGREYVENRREITEYRKYVNIVVTYNNECKIQIVPEDG